MSKPSASKKKNVARSANKCKKRLRNRSRKRPGRALESPPRMALPSQQAKPNRLRLRPPTRGPMSSKNKWRRA